MAGNRREGLRDLAITIILIVTSLVVSRFARHVLAASTDDTFLLDFLGEAAMSLPVFVATFVLGRTSLYRWNRKLLKAGWMTALFTLVYSALLLIISPKAFDASIATPAHIALFVAHMALVGYCEEMLFRGYAQNAFHTLFGEESWLSVLLAVICGGLLFGGVHLSNAFESDIAITAATAQALSAAFDGMYLCGIYYRTGRCLWYLAALHALSDAAIFIANGMFLGYTTGDIINSASAPSIAQIMFPMVLFGGLTLFILRPSKVKPLIRRRRTRRNSRRTPTHTIR